MQAVNGHSPIEPHDEGPPKKFQKLRDKFKLSPKPLETQNQNAAKSADLKPHQRFVKDMKFILKLNFPEKELVEDFIAALRQKDEPGTPLGQSRTAAVSRELIDGLVFGLTAAGYHAAVGIATPLFFIPISLGKLAYATIMEKNRENLAQHLLVDDNFINYDK